MKSFDKQWKKLTAVVCLASGCLLLAATAQAQQPAESSAPAVADPFAVITTPSGLQIRELVTGTGPMATLGSTVSVHYTGWLKNPDGSRGTKFDSSRDRGAPLDFVIGEGNVIKGWEEGIKGMKVGGKRRLTVPAGLAYGAKSSGSIPAFSVLLFDVELMGVK